MLINFSVVIGAFQMIPVFLLILLVLVVLIQKKRGTSFCAPLRPHLRSIAEIGNFFPDEPMEFVIPVIPNKDHQRRVFSIYALTQASENEIVDASSSSPNTIPRSKDRVACMPVVDLVSTSSERLIESIKSDRLDINSPPSKAKENVN